MDGRKILRILKKAVEYVILNWNYDTNYEAKERVYNE